MQDHDTTDDYPGKYLRPYDLPAPPKIPDHAWIPSKNWMKVIYDAVRRPGQ